MDIKISCDGTPKGIRIIITIGEVSGRIENAVAMDPWGLFNTDVIPMNKDRYKDAMNDMQTFLGAKPYIFQYSSFKYKDQVLYKCMIS